MLAACSGGASTADGSAAASTSGYRHPEVAGVSKLSFGAEALSRGTAVNPER